MPVGNIACGSVRCCPFVRSHRACAARSGTAWHVGGARGGLGSGLSPRRLALPRSEVIIAAAAVVVVAAILLPGPVGRWLMVVCVIPPVRWGGFGSPPSLASLESPGKCKFLISKAGWVWRCDAAISRCHEETCLFCAYIFVRFLLAAKTVV